MVCMFRMAENIGTKAILKQEGAETTVRVKGIVSHSSERKVDLFHDSPDVAMTTRYIVRLPDGSDIEVNSFDLIFIE